MKTPSTRKEFERHLFMLSEGIKQRRYHLPNDRRMIKSLLNAKALPNVRINFITINETVRLMANSRATFESQAFKNQFNNEQ